MNVMVLMLVVTTTMTTMTGTRVVTFHFAANISPRPSPRNALRNAHDLIDTNLSWFHGQSTSDDLHMNEWFSSSLSPWGSQPTSQLARVLCPWRLSEQLEQLLYRCIHTGHVWGLVHPHWAWCNFWSNSWIALVRVFVLEEYATGITIEEHVCRVRGDASCSSSQLTFAMTAAVEPWASN